VSAQEQVSSTVGLMVSALRLLSSFDNTRDGLLLEKLSLLRF